MSFSAACDFWLIFDKILCVSHDNTQLCVLLMAALLMMSTVDDDR